MVATSNQSLPEMAIDLVDLVYLVYLVSFLKSNPH